MSEVDRYSYYGAMFVRAADFDAEHALRLSAEKLQEMWAGQNADLRKANPSLREKLTEAEDASRLYGSQRDAANKRADEAERQVGELREQLRKAEAASDRWKFDYKNEQDTVGRVISRCDRLRSKLDKAMGLLREGLEEVKEGDDWIERVVELLRDTTSTEGKDHE